MKQLLSIILLCAVFVFAQSGFSLNSSGIHVPSARTLSPGDLFVIGGFEMANSSKPASIEGFLVDENGEKHELTKDSPSNTILGYVGYGILDYLEVGLNLNVHYDGNAGDTKLKGLGFGDIGLLTKVQLPNQSLRDFFNFAAALEIFIPSGTIPHAARHSRFSFPVPRLTRSTSATLVCPMLLMGRARPLARNSRTGSRRIRFPTTRLAQSRTEW